MAGLAAHTLLVAWRWIGAGHLPAEGTFENALLGAWFIVAMTAWAAHRERYPLVAAAALPFALARPRRRRARAHAVPARWSRR